MKILHAIAGIRKAAGTSVFVSELSTELATFGHDVVVAVVDPAAEDACSLDARVRCIGFDYDEFERVGFDVIHIHALWTPVLHKVSCWAYEKRIPVVWSPHGMLTTWAMNNKKWKKMFGWWLYQKKDLTKANLLHVTAQCEVEDVRRLGLRNKLVIAPLGVRVDRGVKSIDRSGEVKVLLFVSRVQRKKGLLNLVQAWAQIPLEIKRGWKVRIVGPDQEGHVEEVRAECEKMGGAVDWEFAGPKFGKELQEEYRRASLFVLPTYSENFGSVVVEALAQCVPVITTKGAPWGELEKFQCGWWVDIGVEPLVTAMEEAMMVSDEERRQMGERGRKLVEAKYTWDAVAQKIVEGYESLIK